MLVQVQVSPHHDAISYGKSFVTHHRHQSSVVARSAAVQELICCSLYGGLSDAHFLSTDRKPFQQTSESLDRVCLQIVSITSWLNPRNSSRPCPKSFRSCRLVRTIVDRHWCCQLMTSTELQSTVEARQKLESQQQENKGVQKVSPLDSHRQFLALVLTHPGVLQPRRQCQHL